MENHFGPTRPPNIKYCHFGHPINLNDPTLHLDAWHGHEKEAGKPKVYCQVCEKYYTVAYLKEVKEDG